MCVLRCVRGVWGAKRDLHTLTGCLSERGFQGMTICCFSITAESVFSEVISYRMVGSITSAVEPGFVFILCLLEVLLLCQDT